MLCQNSNNKGGGGSFLIYQRHAHHRSIGMCKLIILAFQQKFILNLIIIWHNKIDEDSYEIAII